MFYKVGREGQSAAENKAAQLPHIKERQKKMLVNSSARWIYFPPHSAAVVKSQRQKCDIAETKPKTVSPVHDTNMLCGKRSHTCIYVRNHSPNSVTGSLGDIKHIAWDFLTVLFKGESIGDSNRS